MQWFDFIISGFALIFVVLFLWALFNSPKVDNDIDIDKNKYNWWKDKNLK